MENPKIYVSKTVEAMVDENHPLSEKLKKMETIVLEHVKTYPAIAL